MRRYEYRVNVKVMEEVYRENTGVDFFEKPEDRDNFNARLIVYAEDEDHSFKIRSGITHIPMWDLL